MNPVCYYDHWTKELKGSIVSKARKFVKFRLVKYVGNGCWHVDPIEGYNTRTYLVTNKKGEDGIRSFECNCQGFQTKLRKFKEGNVDEEPYCSHTVAVKMHAGTAQHLRSIRGEKC